MPSARIPPSDGTGGDRAAYECSASRADQQSTATCRSIAADTVDEAVTERLLACSPHSRSPLALAAAEEVRDREEVHGCLTVHDVAMRLGVPADAVYYWIRLHRLHARRTTSGRWSIPWNDEVEASARQFAARTKKFTPTMQTTTAGGAV